MKQSSASRKIYPPRTLDRLVYACLGLLLLLVGLPGRTEEPKLYTNADLASLPPLDLPASSAPAPVRAQAPASAAPAKAAPAAMAYEAPRLESVSPVREEYRALSELRVRIARARVEELEYRLLSVEDAFLPRPQLSAEEQRLWLHLDNVQRANYVDDQLAEARGELMDAEAALARVRGDGVL